MEAGTVKLVGTDYHKIVNEVSALLDEPEYYDRMSKAVNPYGDGEACKRIINTIHMFKNKVLMITGGTGSFWVMLFLKTFFLKFRI